MSEILNKEHILSVLEQEFPHLYEKYGVVCF